MDRVAIQVAHWSNPDYSRQLPAVEPEPLDRSTVDPSHIIKLIRQLLPSGARPQNLSVDVCPVEQGLLASKVVAGVPLCKKGIVKDSLKTLDGGTVYKNGTLHEGQVGGRPSMIHDRVIEANVSSTGSARECASTEFSTVDLRCKELSKPINPCQGNGNSIRENGDPSRKRVRDISSVVERNGDILDHVDHRSWKTSEKVSEAALISVGPIKAEDDAGHPMLHTVEQVGSHPENDAHQKTVWDDDTREEAGCVLWDLAATEIHAEFLVKHHILEVLFAILRVSYSDRIREISLGIFGNLACHTGPAKAMVGIEGLVETLVQQLFMDNAPCLTETCRLLSAGLHSELTVIWVESIKPDHVLERIMWMAANTLNSHLLEKCTELILVMVDSRRDAAFVLIPSLLRLGLPGLLTDLIACELTAISEGTSSRGDVVLDIVLQIAEAISIPDDTASQLAASDKLFSLSCDVIRLSARDEIGPSGITATVLIANLLTEEAGLIKQVLQDAILLGRLLALVPCAGDDPGARNALWSILGRICRCLVSTKPEDLPNATLGMIVVLADGCSLLLEDLDVHQEEDIEEDEDEVLAGHDAAANTSRGLQAKLATVCNMMHIMENWTTVCGHSSTQDLPVLRSVRNAILLLKKHLSASEISLGRDSGGLTTENGGFFF